MTTLAQPRPIWRAALWGTLIALAEMMTLLVLLAWLEAFGPTPSGYAGAGFGAALAMLFGVLLAAAGAIGLLAGGLLFRRRRPWWAMWGGMLLVLALLAAFAAAALFMLAPSGG
jgi:hypothetical protein